MGIDVLLMWDDPASADREIVHCGIDQGHLGYIREPYHEGVYRPEQQYATRVLFREPFDAAHNGKHRYRPGVLPRRLPTALAVVRDMPIGITPEERAERLAAGEILLPPAFTEAERQTAREEIMQSLVAFVELHERLLAERKKPTVYMDR